MLHQETTTFQGAHGLRLSADRWELPGSERGTVLLLHGGGQTRHSWTLTARSLAGDGWQTWTIDTRGHGDSEWSPDGLYTLDDFTADLYAIVAQLGTRPVVVGASLGGRTALTAEGERPGTLAGLVLVDITHRTEQSGQSRVKRFMTGAPHGFATLEEAADAISAYRPGRPRHRSLDGLKRNLRRREDGRWYWHWDPQFLGSTADAGHYSPERLRRAARGIAIPTLLVRGLHSDIVTAESAAEFLDLVPTAREVGVAAGHMITGDDNDVFTSHLQEFLTHDVT
ncbi:alpha/beta fold hydrolase [Amycolatopsis keratiniphila]|uniref:Alpha/beta hydrolase n=1 Tax=Amycolatopsis keratiniphila subsp. keratiniphila TaxID=227715 RepID=A0A1W2M1G4_9PSEU|nr:alpha/beta fold hydrolase [Amycolatopsis keratiniphila]ONF73683.1 alpha/beta hydrolase [Amycolatopsis keratiniphila subsp. keratiniphila]